MGPKSTERRLFPRVPAHQAVLVEPARNGGSPEFGPAEDLSPGGCQVLLDEHMLVDSPVHFSMAVEGLVLQAEGHVVRTEPHPDGRWDTAIAFDRINPSHRAVLRRILEGVR